MKPANAADGRFYPVFLSFTIFVVSFVLNSSFPFLFLQGVKSHSCLCILDLEENRPDKDVR